MTAMFWYLGVGSLLAAITYFKWKDKKDKYIDYLEKKGECRYEMEICIPIAFFIVYTFLWPLGLWAIVKLYLGMEFKWEKENK